jgi:DNA polymerase-3 subunit delta
VAAAAARLYLLAEERRGEFDGYRADRALEEIRRSLEAGGKTVAVLAYHAADCEADTLAEAIETPSLFGARTLIVLRGAEALDERAQERLVRSLDGQAPQVTLAVVARGADMRRRFFTRCRDLGRRVPVDHPRASEMRGWADGLARERRRRLEDEARELLIDGVGRDLLLLATELDKLVAAVPESRPIAAADVERVTVAGREHGNFEVVGALCARDLAAALRLLARSLDQGAQPIALIGALGSSLKTLLAGAELVVRGRSVDAAERELGLTFYQRRTFQRGVRAYRAVELRRALGRLAALDLAVKTGAGDPRPLLEEWALGFCLGDDGRRGATRQSGGR